MPLFGAKQVGSIARFCSQVRTDAILGVLQAAKDNGTRPKTLYPKPYLSMEEPKLGALSLM